MPKNPKVETNEVPLVSNDPTVSKPRLVKLVIKNFRCIGPVPVEIDLNDIVVLVGPNNVGKSSILRAYEVVMSHGSNKAKLVCADFPGNKIDSINFPEIEIHTIVYDNTPGEKWIETTISGEKLIREKWTWKDEGEPKRQGWDVTSNSWSDNVPWGAPNVANTRRPEPHRVDAFDSPEDQAEAIKKLLKQVLEERVKSLKSSQGEDNDYNKLLDQIKSLQKKIVTETQGEIDIINKELTALISKVFPKYKIDFDARPEDNIDKTINLFKEDAQLLMGPEGGHLSTIDRQGSGARRTLLWTALKFISENGQKKKQEDDIVRPHLLLIDEPEICLHPSAVRDACNVLYELPKTGNWQVVVTTHSPVFIDFSKDNTTIVKVERKSNGEIKGTTVYRPDKVKLDDDDKRNLKLLNLCDPYVAEFFFGGKTIIVEGDTEYTAFKYIVEKKPDKYKDLHIIRARGKSTIVSLIKVLNHFGSDYAILHDSDTPTITSKKGEQRNGAWTVNENIMNAVNLKPANTRVRVLASVPNFERAYFKEEISYDKDKPYNALRKLETDQSKFDVVEKLLDALVDHGQIVPAGAKEWNIISDLETALNSSV